MARAGLGGRRHAAATLLCEPGLADLANRPRREGHILPAGQAVRDGAGRHAGWSATVVVDCEPRLAGLADESDPSHAGGAVGRGALGGELGADLAVTRKTLLAPAVHGWVGKRCRLGARMRTRDARQAPAPSAACTASPCCAAAPRSRPHSLEASGRVVGVAQLAVRDKALVGARQDARWGTGEGQVGRPLGLGLRARRAPLPALLLSLLAPLTRLVGVWAEAVQAHVAGAGFAARLAAEHVADQHAATRSVGLEAVGADLQR